MNYLEHTTNGVVITTKTVVKLYDIVQPRVGYWKGKLSIVTHVDKDKKLIRCRIIENGMDMIYKVKDIVFINHNNRTAAKSYFELCERMRSKFIAKYSDINYIKEHFDDDDLMINDITAATICNGSGIYITNNETSYSAKALNWLANNKILISAILRIPDMNVLEKTHQDDIIDCGYINVVKLYKYFYGEDGFTAYGNGYNSPNI